MKVLSFPAEKGPKSGFKNVRSEFSTTSRANFKKSQYTFNCTNLDSLKKYFVYFCYVRWPRNYALSYWLDKNKYCKSRLKRPEQM